MKKLKEFFIKNRNRFIIVISSLLIALALISIYFAVEVNVMSNDECLWLPEKTDKDSIAIIFDLVKVDGVTWKAGIRNGDQLLAINDVPLPNTAVAQRELNKVNSGEYAKYTVMRDGEIFTTNVYIKKLFFFGHLAQGIFSLFFIIIGFIVLLAKPDGVVQKLFYGLAAAFVFSVSFYIIRDKLFFQNFRDVDLFTLAVVYLWLLSICFIPFLFAYFFWIFPKPFKFLEKKWVKSVIFIIPGFIFIVYFSIMILTFGFNLLREQIFFKLLGLSDMIFIAGISVAYVSLIINYRRLKTKEEKKPVAIILAAFTLAVLAALYTAFIAPAITDVIYNSPEFYTPIILIVIFPLAFAYAIFRYQLMDVSVVVRNTIVYGAATITVLAIYFLVIYLLGQSISRAIGTEYQAVIAGVAFIIFALVFQSTKNRFQDFLTQKFYPEQFAYQKVLISFSNEVSTLIGLDNILDSMKDTYVNALKIQNFGILLKDYKSGRLKLVRQVGISVSDLELKAAGLPQFIRDKAAVSQPPFVEQHDFVNVFPGNSVILANENIYTAIPMIIKQKVIGLLLFGLKHSGSQFSGKDIELLVASANQSAIAIENARLYESEAEKNKIENDLELARKIQQGLLPKCIPEIHGLNICGQMVPAQQVGGDYFDLIPVSERKLYVIVGDVSGKGLSASLYMTKLQTMMQLACKTERSPKEILIDINKSFYETIERNWFVTLTLALFDTGKNTVKFCRAGHMPLLIAQNGNVDVYKTQGLGLGLENGKLFSQTLIEEELNLKEGQIYAFFSDGITEAMNEKMDMFGENKLTTLLINQSTRTTSEIMDTIWIELDKFRGTAAPSDDMTMVLVKVK
jgi:serine phosphatase RsbU (regulator of sigma subunit)